MFVRRMKGVGRQYFKTKLRYVINCLIGTTPSHIAIEKSKPIMELSGIARQTFSVGFTFIRRWKGFFRPSGAVVLS